MPLKNGGKFVISNAGAYAACELSHRTAHILHNMSRALMPYSFFSLTMNPKYCLVLNNSAHFSKLKFNRLKSLKKQLQPKFFYL
jgi:hypothetical protein